MIRSSLGLFGLLIFSSIAAADSPNVSELIDRHLALRWTSAGVRPAGRSDDAEFIRRVYLDLAGRIPSIIEVRDFLDDTRPDKRRIWVDQLLDGPRYPLHFGNVFRTWWLPAAASPQYGFLAQGFEKWLRRHLQENTGYDRIVRELLTLAPGGSADGSPEAFYQLNERKPENLAASTARLFLGVKLECAQCHNHPFARWTRQQFWEQAAFLAGLEAGKAPDRIEIAIPGTDKIAQARFLGGGVPPLKAGSNPRAILADWMTAADNPYFARAAVNRLWSYFFGIGLAEPVDELDGQNPPSHPELLDALAQSFIASRYDVKGLIRALVLSHGYQLTSARPPKADPRLFASMAVRGLTGEQLFDSLAEATEFRGGGTASDYAFEDPRNRSPRAQFLVKFTYQERRTEVETSILQALSMMNGTFIADATSLETSKTLATVADAVSTDTARRIETLYLVALARKPRPEERERLVRYVNAGGPHNDPRRALGDVFWALLNSSEFVLNH